MAKKIDVEVKFPVRFSVDLNSFKSIPDDTRKQELTKMARELLDDGEWDQPEVQEHPGT